MMPGFTLGWPRGLFSPFKENSPPANVLAMTLWPTAAYAVGDIHGCFFHYRDLEARIAADIAALGGVGVLILLGDFVDRGPMTAALLDHLIAPPPRGLIRLALRGNHEEMFEKFLRAPDVESRWLKHGGLETLASYGIDTLPFATGSLSARRMRLVLDTMIPQEHRRLLQDLPDALILDPFMFVHAGVDPECAPESQSRRTLLWGMRDGGAVLEEGAFAYTVVHGHIPQADCTVQVSPHRVNLDTGCYASGKLSAARFLPDGSVMVLE